LRITLEASDQDLFVSDELMIWSLWILFI